MTTKTDFAPEAWQVILAAPAAISQLVMTASFSMFDMFKETRALIRQTDALIEQPGDLPLMIALAAEFKQKKEHSSDEAKGTTQSTSTEKKDAAEEKTQLLAGLKSAVAAVDATATSQEAVQLKQWLYSVGEAVASAAKEGDFLGIGGERVNAAESSILDEIKTVLGL